MQLALAALAFAVLVTMHLLAIVYVRPALAETSSNRRRPNRAGRPTCNDARQWNTWLLG